MEGVDTESDVNLVGLVQKRNGNAARTRRWVLITGLAPPSQIGVFNNNLKVAHRAFAERYFRCRVGEALLPPLPTTDEQWIRDPLMVQYLEDVCRSVHLVPMVTADDVVLAYKGAKRAVYERALQDFDRDGVTERDARLNSFVKFEKCSVVKPPRVINPRSAKFNLALGRWLKYNEHAYFDAIARVWGQERVVYKGMDVYETAQCLSREWDRYTDAVACGSDAVKFDFHVRRAALVYEHMFYVRPLCASLGEALSVYRRVLHEAHKAMDYKSDVENLCWLLCHQLVNRGKAYFDDGSLEFCMSGTRSSGDLNTSLGNCLIMSAMQWAWARTCRVECSLVNNGDDCQTLMSSVDLQRYRDGWVEFFVSKGFRMELEDPAVEFEQVEFCQSRPCFTSRGFVMVRNPRTLITKASMCIRPVSNVKTLRKWIMAVGVAEGSLSGGVPVLQSFARALRRNGLRCTRKALEAAKGDSSRYVNNVTDEFDCEIVPEARYSFFMAFGVTPDEQMELERHYDKWVMGREFGDYIASHEAVERASVPHAAVVSLL